MHSDFRSALISICFSPMTRANPTLQQTYQSAAEDGLRMRLLPSETSSSAPMIMHTHKGVVELDTSRRDELEREEENARREGEERKRKRAFEEEQELHQEAAAKRLNAVHERAASGQRQKSGLIGGGDGGEGNSSASSSMPSAFPGNGETSLDTSYPTLHSTSLSTSFSLDDLLKDDQYPSSSTSTGGGGDLALSVSSSMHPSLSNLEPSSHLSHDGEPEDDVGFGGGSPFHDDGLDERGLQGHGPQDAPMLDFWVDDEHHADPLKEEAETTGAESFDADGSVGDRADGDGQAKTIKNHDEDEQVTGRRKLAMLTATEPVWQGVVRPPSYPFSAHLILCRLFDMPHSMSRPLDLQSLPGFFCL